MARKGFGTDKVIYTIFVIAIGMMLLSFIGLRLTEPTIATYSQEDAQLTCYMTASAINALSTEEKGLVEINFRQTWNIIVYNELDGKVLVFSHMDSGTGQSVSAKIPLMGNVEVTDDMYYITRLTLEKNPGQPVTVRGVS